MAKCLKINELNPATWASVKRFFRFIPKVYARFIKKNRTHTFSTGGRVIAIIGPEATGKSTISRILVEWFGEFFEVLHIHGGNPPPTWVTWVPNTVIPVLRKLLPRFRTTNIDSDVYQMGQDVLSGPRLFVYVVRSLMIAFDRRQLLVRVFKSASKGCVVICDRYPTVEVGAMDSAQLDQTNPSIAQSAIYRKLARIEEAWYQSIPPPDIVVQLYVPVDIAVKRNVERQKPEVEDEAYVRRRHNQSEIQRYDRSIVIRVDTSQDIESTILKIKAAVLAHM